MNSTPPTLVFDFDGTLTDVLAQADMLLAVYNRLAQEHGFQKIDKNDMPKLRGFKPRELLRYLHIPFLKFPLVIKELHKELSANIAHLQPAPGIPEVLRELHKKHFNLGILTSNSKENVEAFLKNHDLEVFDFLYSGSSTFGKHRIMLKMLKEQQLDSKNVWYFGDETRDIEASQKIGCKVIGVSWGLNNKSILQQCHPEMVIDGPQEILEISEKIFSR